ncbi:MAG: hypothetical protein H7837_00945 [Magnetococcus sp. MYC-9]
MLTGFFKWILKHFMPYIAGVLVGVGFFFILVELLPMMSALPEIPALDRFLSPPKKEVSVPLPTEPATMTAITPPAPATPPAPRVVAPAVPERVVEVPPSEPVVPSAPPVAVVSDQGVAPAAPNQGAPQTEMRASRQPQESAELDRDPLEMVPARAASGKPAAVRPVRESAPTADCGMPPSRPGPRMDQYLACQWRADCLNRLARARGMIEQERRRCPSGGSDAQACLAYYRSLEQQYHPSLCNGWSNGQMPGWW